MTRGPLLADLRGSALARSVEMPRGTTQGVDTEESMKIKPIVSVGVLAALLAVGSSPAYADDGASPALPDGASDIAVVDPIDATLVIDGEVADIAVMPDFDPQAPAVVLDEGGNAIPVSDIELVYADGRTTNVAKVDTANKAALASCWKSWVAPGNGAWTYSVLAARS